MEVGDTSADDAEDELRARAGRFCTWFRWEAYPCKRGVPYTPTAAVERSDLDSAVSLAKGYTDDELLRIAEFFLDIPDDRDRFLKGKQRTVSMLAQYAAPIMERLRAS